MSTQTSEPAKAEPEVLEADFEKQLADEGLKLAGREPTPAPDGKPADAPKEKDGDAPKDGDGKEKPADGPKDDKNPSPKKDEKPKSDDAWRHAIARRREEQQAQKDKKIADLEKENAELKSKPDPSKTPDPPKKDEPKEETLALTDEQKQLAAKYGIEESDFHKLFPTRTVEKVVEKQGLSDEQSKLLESLKADKEQLEIEKGYRTDFDATVLPLIKEEYPDISSEELDKIRSEIFELIQTDELALTPLAVLYRGDATFRSRVAPKREGPDDGGKPPGKTGKVWDFSKVSEADMNEPGFPTEEYFAWTEKQGKSS